ncbi:MAG: hypothetical protein WC362_04985 [Methanoregula sp.]|jgi:hypothetical protein
MVGTPRHPALCLLLCTALSLACAGCIFDPTPRALSTNTDYQLQIISTEPLYNVTFYLPLPQKNGTPMAGSLVLTGKYFASGNYSSEFVQSPPGADPGWRVPGIDTEPLYLKVTADRMYPNETFGTQFFFFYENKTVLASPLDYPDTITPLGNESVILQKVNFSGKIPTPDFSKDPTLIRYHAVVINQKVPIYVEYSASPTAWVNVYSQVLVMNRWEAGGQQRQNHYADTYSWIHTGDAHGWQTANGFFASGNGPYPNLSSPVWQDVIHPPAVK